MKKCPNCGFFQDEFAQKCTNCGYAFFEPIQAANRQVPMEQVGSTNTAKRQNSRWGLAKIVSLVFFFVVIVTAFLPWWLSFSMWDILSVAIPRGPGEIWRLVTGGGSSAGLLSFIVSIGFIVTGLCTLAAFLSNPDEVSKNKWFSNAGYFGVGCCVIMFFYVFSLPLFSVGIGFGIFLAGSIAMFVTGLIAE